MRSPHTLRTASVIFACCLRVFSMVIISYMFRGATTVSNVQNGKKWE